MLDPAVLMLEEIGMIVVYPIVKWKRPPAIGVEFMDMKEPQLQKIMSFLYKVERKRLRNPIRVAGPIKRSAAGKWTSDDEKPTRVQPFPARSVPRLKK
jgi:hypothetical protein